MNAKVPMTNVKSSSNAKDREVYDLEERTAQFGEAVIDFVRLLPKTTIIPPLTIQVVKSATSIGANYMEADETLTKRDFRHSIVICRKEAKETGHWLRMIARAMPEKTGETRMLWQEAHELVLIFSAILKKQT